MSNEPVAIRYDFDGYGYQYMDSGSGSDWQSRVKGEPLYTHPAELTDEEIIWVYQNLWQFLPSEEPDLAKDIKKFARAILRKAQEK
jgi:hypothetical protein